VPSRRADSAGHREEGTAAVELIAVAPFLLLALVVAAQFALAGQALWSAAVAARAGARAELVGGDAERAARRALPPPLRPAVRVKEGGAVAVSVTSPRLLPWFPPLRVGAESGLGE
jgi:hypothetical protein